MFCSCSVSVTALVHICGAIGCYRTFCSDGSTMVRVPAAKLRMYVPPLPYEPDGARRQSRYRGSSRSWRFFSFVFFPLLFRLEPQPIRIMLFELLKIRIAQHLFLEHTRIVSIGTRNIISVRTLDTLAKLQGIASFAARTTRSRASTRTQCATHSLTATR